MKKQQQEIETEPKVSKALILAAGAGMRLVPPLPKPVFKLLGIPLLARTLFTLEEAGITDAYIVLGYEKDQVRAAIQAISRFKINLHWLKNDQWEKPLGLSVLAAEGVLEEPFILCMCDHIFDPRIVERLKAQPLNSDGVILAADYDLERASDIDDAVKVRVVDGCIQGIDRSLTEYDAVETGFFLAQPQIFTALREAGENGDPSLSAGIQRLADQDRAQVMDTQGLMWADIDTLTDAKQGSKKLMATLGKPEDGLVSRYVNRPASKILSRWLVRTPISPNQVTSLNMILGIAGGAIASIGGYWPFLICAILSQLNSIIDGTDGELARLKFQHSLRGEWWDTIADNIAYLFFILGSTIGVRRAGLPGVYFVFGILAFTFTFFCMVSLYMLMSKEGTSGSVLSVKYGFEKRKWLRHILHFIGKRDTWALAFLFLAIFGKLHYYLVIIAVFAFGLLLATLKVNLQRKPGHAAESS